MYVYNRNKRSHIRRLSCCAASVVVLTRNNFWRHLRDRKTSAFLMACTSCTVASNATGKIRLSTRRYEWGNVLKVYISSVILIVVCVLLAKSVTHMWMRVMPFSNTYDFVPWQLYQCLNAVNKNADTTVRPKQAEKCSHKQTIAHCANTRIKMLTQETSQQLPTANTNNIR